MSTNIDHLIQDLESTDSPLGPTFRAVFDSNQHKEFSELLQSKIKVLDKDIEKLCSHYYQGFTESIHELPSIRNDLNKLKKDISLINNDIQNAGKRLESKLEDAIRYDKILNNIDIASNCATICVPVLTTYIKLQHQLQDKRYYAALKTLESFEKLYLPYMSSSIQFSDLNSQKYLLNDNCKKEILLPSSPPSYSFLLAKALKNSVSDVRENIRKASEAELRDFLEIIRQRSGYIGKMAMKNQAFRTKFAGLNSILNRLKYKTTKINFNPPLLISSSRNHDDGLKPIDTKSHLSVTTPDLHSATNMKTALRYKKLIPQAQDGNLQPTGHILNNNSDDGYQTSKNESSNPFDPKAIDNVPNDKKMSNGIHQSEFSKSFGPRQAVDEDASEELNMSALTNLDIEKNSSISIFEQGVDPSKLVDFSPLYRCLHINTMLGNIDNFIEYYRKQREKQIKLILQPSHAQINESLEIYQSYLYEIAGFFLVENYVMCSTKKSGLVNKAYLDDLWINTSTKSIALLKTKSAYSTDTLVLLELKNLIILFYLTLKEYNYSVNRIYELLIEIREQYHEILRMQMVQLFRAALSKDNYHPIVCKSSELLNLYYLTPTDTFYSKLIAFNLKEIKLLNYPFYFPFSESLPLVYDHIRTYVLTCHTFSKDFPNISSTELDDTLRKAVLNLLTRSLSGCMAALIKSPDLYVDQLIQISVNIEYLEKCMPLIDDHISQLSRTSSQTLKLAGIHTQNILKDIIEETSSRIKNTIKQCIEKIVSTAKFDWMCNNPISNPSEFIVQFKEFFDKYLFSYPNTAETSYQSAIDYAFQTVAQALLNYLTVNDKIRMISLQSLHNYQCNLADLIESFNNHICRDASLKSLNLFRHFREINQLLNLIIKLDWANYLTEYGKRNSSYNLVASKTATAMLEKLMLGEKQKDNILSNMISSDQKKSEKKKINETLLKQLKQMGDNNPSQNTATTAPISNSTTPESTTQTS